MVSYQDNSRTKYGFGSFIGAGHRRPEEQKIEADARLFASWPVGPIPFLDIQHIEDVTKCQGKRGARTLIPGMGFNAA